jgi:O-antigen/teichoic acid export membrane protein
VIPIALGGALYPDIGVSFFSREKFGAAEINLRILSVFLFLVYFSMPLGTCILASGKQRAWSAVQALCIVVSLVGDPLLIPYFQDNYKNGSLGLCVAAVISEVLVTAWGIWLAPKGLFDRELGRTLLLTLVAGGVMMAIAILLRGLNSFIAAPFAVLGYVVTLWLTGGIDKSHLELLPGFKRFQRAR